MQHWIHSTFIIDDTRSSSNWKLTNVIKAPCISQFPSIIIIPGIIILPSIIIPPSIIIIPIGSAYECISWGVNTHM